MAAKKYLKLGTSGRPEQQTAADVSTGVSEAGQIVALGSTGKLDPSLFPTGMGPDLLVAPASEGLSAGDYVNIWDDAGVVSVRLADNSNDRPAHGFVKTAVLAAANASVFFEGANDATTGKTKAARQYLGVAGGTIETPLDPTNNANTGKLHQFLGIAVATTSINTDIDDEYVL